MKWGMGHAGSWPPEEFERAKGALPRPSLRVYGHLLNDGWLSRARNCDDRSAEGVQPRRLHTHCFGAGGRALEYSTTLAYSRLHKRIWRVLPHPQDDPVAQLDRAPAF